MTPVTPEQFFGSLFNSKAVQQGAVIRRKVRDVERLVGRDLFIREMKRRGYTRIQSVRIGPQSAATPRQRVSFTDIA